MPIYVFENPNTLELIEVFQSINEEHSYYDESGLKYNRVITPPFVSFDTKIDPYSSSSFIEKTKNKKGTIGDLLDASRDLSEKRGGDKNDPVKNKYYKDYEKKNGVKHVSEISEIKKTKLNNVIKKTPIKISL